MRVSCCSTDPGYANFRGLGAHRVYLNGSEVQEAVTADEELGEILRIARDEYGGLIVDGGEIVHEMVRGKVEIVTAATDKVGLAPNVICGTTTGRQWDRDSRTGAGPQPDAGPGSREAGAR